MTSRVLRFAIYLFVIAAFFFLGLGLAIDFGVQSIPIGDAYVVDLAPSSALATRLGLVVGGMAALLFMVERLRSR